MKAKRLAIAAAIALSLIVAVAAIATSRTSTATAAEPIEVDQMPLMIPEEGVTLLAGVADVTLMTASAEAQASAQITAEKAISIAPSPETALAPGTLFANVTVGSTLPPPGESSKGYRVIQNRLSWIVTYTFPEPIDVRVGAPYTGPGATPPPPIMKTHTHFVIDAETGEFLLGFFTT